MLIAVIYLSFISLGLPDSLLGAGWASMHKDFGVPVSVAGVVTMIICGGTIVSSLLSERLIKKLGTKYVTLLSVVLTALSLFGFSTADSFALLCIWAVPYGLGAGAIDAALNNYVALNYSSRHMSWLHCFWGVGTIISPYIMSTAMTYSVWRDGYRAVSYIQFLISAVLLFTLSLWKTNNAGENGEKTARALGISGAVKIPGVAYILVGFLCYCAAESTCMLWASTYLIGVRNVPEERAAAFASLFFIGITAGRFVSGLLTDKLGDKKMIRLGTCIAAFGVLLVGLPFLPEQSALAGFVVIGLGCAPIYPGIIHSTPSSFGKENSQAIIGVQMACAYVGSTFAPLLFGFLSSLSGLWIMPLYVGAFFVLMIASIEKSNRLCKA